MKFFDWLTDTLCGRTVLVILFILIFIAISFFTTAGILWVINWAFGLNFWSWKACLGIWCAISILEGIFTTHVKVEK